MASDRKSTYGLSRLHDSNLSLALDFRHLGIVVGRLILPPTVGLRLKGKYGRPKICLGPVEIRARIEHGLSSAAFSWGRQNAGFGRCGCWVDCFELHGWTAACVGLFLS